jgi:hypothetical protein
VTDPREDLTHEYLCRILDYDRDTGIFTWKPRPFGRFTGKPAGYNSGRYIRIVIDQVKYYAHHLAWFYVYETWATDHLDHIDRDKMNNRIGNLRECRNNHNMMNKPPLRNNTSGYKGVVWHKGANRWMAQIEVDKIHMYLGLFDTAREAALAYDTAAREHFGAFAYLNLAEAA